MAAAIPSLSGCDDGAPVATEASTSVPAISLDGKEVEIERAALRELGESMTGPVILAGDPRYDSARRIWNGMHDRHPALIARCLSAEDVSNAVTFARERELLVAVRGGGHSWPGHSVCEGGLMIDLSEMRAVTVDGARAHAAGGALLNTLDTAALAQGMVTTAGIVSHTGIGGFTLGGGFGRLGRSYGLAIDNLEGATIVTPDGAVRHTSVEEEPDLFWAIRGGGGNFGVVTEFEYRLHPFERNVLSGRVVWPVAQARDVLEFYAEWSTRLPDAIYVAPAFVTTPDGDRVVMAYVVCNCDPAVGEKVLAPLRKLGRPVADGVKLQDYAVLQTINDAALAHGIRSYAKNGMVGKWTQGLIDTMLDADDPRLFVDNHVMGGAIRRIGELDTAFPHRNPETMLVIVGNWRDPDDDEERIAAARSYHAAVQAFTGGYYTNIDYEHADAAGNYGPAFARLQEVKGRYDPMNLFRLNSNIRPAV